MKNVIKYILNASPVYVYLKKHYCHICGGKVKVTYTSKTVNSKSPEAKNYDFSVGDTYYVGNVEFRICHFRCLDCQSDISFEDMKLHERNTKIKL